MKLNTGEGNGPLLPVISVYNALQDTVTFTETTGSSTAISQSYFTATQSLEVDLVTLHQRLHCRTARVASKHCKRLRSSWPPSTAAGSSSSVKESVVAALSATLYQCSPTLGAKVCHQYYYSSGFNKVTLQSVQLKHSDSYLRGRQQLFMGVLFVHWTTIWVRVERLEVGPLR